MKSNSNKVVKYQSGNPILKESQGLGYLVLGDCNSAMDKKIHKEFDIQTIISIGQQALPIKQKLPYNCKHYFYDIHDNKSQKIPAQLFDEVNQKIESSRKNGGILVHCYAGVSRSSSFVIAYIMQKFNKTYQLAKQIVKKQRNCIYPNDGFVNHLKNYSKVLQQRQNQRLKKIQYQKQLQIDSSVVKTAKKSIRGAVRAADISPQKVKQLAQISNQKAQCIQTQHEIEIKDKTLGLKKIQQRQSFYEIKIVNQQTINKQKNTKQNSTTKIEQKKQEQKIKVKISQSKNLTKNLIKKEQKPTTIKIQKIKIQKNVKQQTLKDPKNKQIKKQQLKQQIANKVSQKIQIIETKQKTKVYQKQQYSSVSLSTTNQVKKQEQLNQKQKHMKQIYKTKLKVK